MLDNDKIRVLDYSNYSENSWFHDEIRDRNIHLLEKVITVAISEIDDDYRGTAFVELFEDDGETASYFYRLRVANSDDFETDPGFSTGIDFTILDHDIVYPKPVFIRRFKAHLLLGVKRKDGGFCAETCTNVLANFFARILSLLGYNSDEVEQILLLQPEDNHSTSNNKPEGGKKKK